MYDTNFYFKYSDLSNDNLKRKNNLSQTLSSLYNTCLPFYERIVNCEWHNITVKHSSLGKQYIVALKVVSHFFGAR